MTSNRQDPSQATQDSDDLIAELARLVAKDARTTSVQSNTYSRHEPSFAPDPEPTQNTRVDWDESATGETPSDFSANATQAADHDYGQAPQNDEDPIAGLIADAEVEAYTRDTGADTGWAEEDQAPPAASFPTEPEPIAHASQEPFRAAPQPVSTERDPLSEIEALIGDAARANADTGMPGRRVRSVFLEDEPTNSAVDAAESAILAAAAATGTPVRRVDPDLQITQAPSDAPYNEPEPNWSDETDGQRETAYVPDPLFAAPSAFHDGAQHEAVEPELEDEYYEEEPIERPARARNRLGGFVLPVAAGVVLVSLIGGAYFMFFAAPPEPGDAPMLTADASPIKEEGAPPEESSAAESVVFNEIEGNDAPVDEALVSRDQTGGATGTDVATAIASDEGETALVNRPVRTVTVRPDGTLVQAEDTVAGSNVLPVERPDVPEVPNSTMTSDPIGAAIAEAMAAEDGLETSETTDTLQTADVAETSTNPTAATESPISTTDGADPTAAAETAPGTNAESAETPLPLPRPENTAVSTDETTVAETTVADTTAADTDSATAALTQTAAEPAAWVQLSSQRSEEAAQAGIAELEARYGSLFNGATPEVNRVDLGERGIYYRVRLPQPSFDDASSVCSAIQGQGGDCFVLNN